MDTIKVLFSIVCMGTSFGLVASQSRLSPEEIEKIKAKYGLSTSTKQDIPVKKTTDQGSLAGDLATTQKKQETVLTGKKLQSQLDKNVIENLDKEMNTKESKQELEEIEDETKKIQEDPEKGIDEAPGFFKSLFSFPKLWYRVSRFNTIAAQNLKRFNMTFNNVGAALASLDEDYILMPKKSKDGSYMTGANKVIIWEKVLAKKITATMIERLKSECQYIIIKEMVDGFKHLQPLIEPVLDVFYYLAPKLASQSRLIYDAASQFLPMLETLAKDNQGPSVQK